MHITLYLFYQILSDNPINQMRSAPYLKACESFPPLSFHRVCFPVQRYEHVFYPFLDSKFLKGGNNVYSPLYPIRGLLQYLEHGI